MYSHIVFDADGTLIDSENAALLSLRDVYIDLFQKDMPLDDFKFSFGLANEEVWKRLDVKCVGRADFLWQKYYAKYSGAITVFDGVREVLDELTGRKRVLGLVTSKPESEYIIDLVPLGITDYFDYIILAGDTVEHKPHPEPLLKFLEYSKSDPESALYIGDTAYDMQCAKNAGVDFALATWGLKQPPEIEADYYLKHPRDIIKLS